MKFRMHHTRNNGVIFRGRRRDNSRAFQVQLFTRNWRSKNHPFWFTSNTRSWATVQSGPFEFHYFKKVKA